MIACAIRKNERGFTLTEVIIASMVLLIALLVIASMFPMGHQQVVDAGRMTLAVTAGRQVLEDIGALPFDSVRNLNGFTTANAATLPGADPELAVARRWRYMIGGPGGGFSFTSAELGQYGSVTPVGGTATIQVTSPPGGTCSAAGSRCQATVTVSVPGLTTNVQLSTIIVRMF
jgi:prepilin-type N-terminal cleavage/methylation domain-containing protein